MTRPWLALCKALLTINFALAGPAHKYPHRIKPWQSPLIIAGLFIIPTSIIWLSGTLAAAFIDTALAIGQPELVLTLTHIVAATFLFVFAVGLTLNAFFFASDTGLLLSLPLQPGHIVSAKLTVALVNMYMASALFLPPVYAVYVVKVPVSAAFFLKAILIFILTPVIPLAVAALFVLLLVRIVGGAKKRDLFVAVGGILAGFVGLGIQYMSGSGSFTVTNTTVFAQRLLQQHGISELLGQSYRPALWSMQTLVGNNVASDLFPLLWLLLTGAVLSATMLVVGRHVFLHAWQRGQEVIPRSSYNAARWRPGGAVSALARAERKLIWRTPAFAVNGLAGFVAIPLLLLMRDGRLELIRKTVGIVDPHSVTVGIIAVAAWFIVGLPFSSLTATGFSREGTRLWVLTSLPVPARHLFLAKLWGTMSVLLLPSTAGAVITAYILQMTPWTTMVGIVVGLLWAVPVAMFGLATDAMWPNLHWTDPNELFRRNVRTFVFAAFLLLVTILFFAIAKRVNLWSMPPNGVVVWGVLGGLATTTIAWSIVTFNIERWLLQTNG